MSKITDCFERVRVVRGVSGGFITLANIETLAESFGLNEQEKGQLMSMIKEKGIVLVSEEEKMKRKAETEQQTNTDNSEKIHSAAEPEARYHRRREQLIEDDREYFENYPERANAYTEYIPELARKLKNIKEYTKENLPEEGANIQVAPPLSLDDVLSGEMWFSIYSGMEAKEMLIQCFVDMIVARWIELKRRPRCGRIRIMFDRRVRRIVDYVVSEKEASVLIDKIVSGESLSEEEVWIMKLIVFRMRHPYGWKPAMSDGDNDNK